MWTLAGEEGEERDENSLFYDHEDDDIDETLFQLSSIPLVRFNSTPNL